MNSNLATYEPLIELFVAMAHYSKRLLKNVTSQLAAHDRVYLGSMLHSSQVTGLDQFYTVGFRRLVVASRLPFLAPTGKAPTLQRCRVQTLRDEREPLKRARLGPLRKARARPFRKGRRTPGSK